RAQLMLALYRAGRQRDALDAYQQARRTLVDELGIEPSTPLRELELAILHQDTTLDRGTGTAARDKSRERVTILFADLVDSQALPRCLDSEELLRLLDRYFAALRAAIERRGGSIETFIGDAVMAVFGGPIDGDDALRAVRAAVDSLAALAALNEEVKGKPPMQLEIRIGLNTCEVSGDDPAGVWGLATGTAVTFAQAAPPGAILLAAETLTLVRGAVKARLAKPRELPKGAPTRAFRLLELVDGADGATR